MNKHYKYIVLVLGLITLFSLDFVRDYIFKNIGFQIYYLNHLNQDGTATIYNYTDSFLESYIDKYNIKQLVNLKWVCTAFFIVLFGIFGSIINGLFYQQKKVIFYFLGLYAVLFCLSLVIYSCTYLSSDFLLSNKLYLIAMEIAHFLQSSLPTLFFFVSFKFYKKSL